MGGTISSTTPVSSFQEDRPGDAQYPQVLDGRERSPSAYRISYPGDPAAASIEDGDFVSDSDSGCSCCLSECQNCCMYRCYEEHPLDTFLSFENLEHLPSNSKFGPSPAVLLQEKLIDAERVSGGEETNSNYTHIRVDSVGDIPRHALRHDGKTLTSTHFDPVFKWFHSRFLERGGMTRLMQRRGMKKYYYGIHEERQNRADERRRVFQPELAASEREGENDTGNEIYTESSSHGTIVKTQIEAYEQKHVNIHSDKRSASNRSQFHSGGQNRMDRREDDCSDEALHRASNLHQNDDVSTDDYLRSSSSLRKRLPSNKDNDELIAPSIQNCEPNSMDSHLADTMSVYPSETDSDAVDPDKVKNMNYEEVDQVCLRAPRKTIGEIDAMEVFFVSESVGNEHEEDGADRASNQPVVPPSDAASTNRSSLSSLPEANHTSDVSLASQVSDLTVPLDAGDARVDSLGAIDNGSGHASLDLSTSIPELYPPSSESEHRKSSISSQNVSTLPLNESEPMRVELSLTTSPSLSPYLEPGSSSPVPVDVQELSHPLPDPSVGSPSNPLLDLPGSDTRLSIHVSGADEETESNAEDVHLSSVLPHSPGDQNPSTRDLTSFPESSLHKSNPANMSLTSSL